VVGYHRYLFGLSFESRQWSAPNCFLRRRKFSGSNGRTFVRSGSSRSIESLVSRAAEAGAD
jgi:hypothetical protein